jgi:hypothetical protein
MAVKVEGDFKKAVKKFNRSVERDGLGESASIVLIVLNGWSNDILRDTLILSEEVGGDVDMIVVDNAWREAGGGRKPSLPNLATLPR